jgi:hypothetical protein
LRIIGTTATAGNTTPDGNIFPSDYYLLFVVNTVRVNSKAK